MQDSEIAWVMGICKKARISVHVRGTDERPVVELKDKASHRIVGGIEVKRRLRDLPAREQIERSRVRALT